MRARAIQHSSTEQKRAAKAASERTNRTSGSHERIGLTLHDDALDATGTDADTGLSRQDLRCVRPDNKSENSKKRSKRARVLRIHREKDSIRTRRGPPMAQ